MNVEVLGQVFTPRFVADKILSLRKNKGKCMIYCLLNMIED